MPKYIGIAALLAPALCWAQAYTISTVAGGVQGPSFDVHDGGSALDASLAQPWGLAFDSAGSLYIADDVHNRVRKVTPGGIISTVAGGQFAPGSGDGGPALRAGFQDPRHVVVDAIGNLYISDQINERIRKVDTSGTVTTLAGGGILSRTLGDGGPAVNATLSAPAGVAVDAAGNLYIADYLNFRIRKVTLDGTITTFAGNGLTTTALGDGGPAIKAFLNGPTGIALDAGGNLYIADTFNNRIRKVAANGIITTIAGSGAGTYSGDGGPAIKAGLNKPEGVAVDTAGNVFIADTGDSRIRMVTQDGTIMTIAGNGSADYTGDGGPAKSAAFFVPVGIALGRAGTIYIGDRTANVVRLLTPTGSATGNAPSIQPGGLVSASAFGQFTSIAPGSWIEIFGSNLAATNRSWTNADFSGVNAPTFLDGTTVTIGGQSAFVDYISPTQVNAQVPSGVATGAQPVIVTSAAGASATYTVTVNPTQAGLLTPSSFLVGGKQNVAALFSDGTTYVLPPGTIAGVTSRRARPGDTITLYGVGFGPVAPNIPAGQIVQQNSALTLPFKVIFGQTQASVTYAGLASGVVGLYQFNVVVPSVPASDSVMLSFTLNGVQSTQPLFICVQN